MKNRVLCNLYINEDENTITVPLQKPNRRLSEYLQDVKARGYIKSPTKVWRSKSDPKDIIDDV